MPSIWIEPSSRKVGANPRTRGPLKSAVRTFSLVSSGVPRSNHSSKSRSYGLLGHADLRQPGRGEEVDDPATREAPRVRSIARPLQVLVMAAASRIGVGQVVADDEDAAGPQELDLPRHERRGIEHVVQDVARDRPVERPE